MARGAQAICPGMVHLRRFEGVEVGVTGIALPTGRDVIAWF